ncbi:hypothetical protein ASE14_16800 [Agromyces sp. Root81]|uniref:hypothetical protein n=1 Tax=Agromyces sp. Root81 TaxID=1736601 RepID=UPI0006FDB39A|nr:hypothetical protein [Agromyces sp. Root81]KRC59387.1 hypothetical protein ASE14_16800 [Agromyces sp. Root81]
MSLERRTTRLAALGAAIAMGGGLALAGAVPAQAAEVEPTEIAYVGAADIRPDETSYVGWHDGASGGSFADSDGDLELGRLEITGKVQILNGFDAAADNGDLRELIDAGIWWNSFNAYFQIPLFFDDAAGDQQFTTLRPASTSTDQVALGDEWTTSRAIPGAYDANATDSLENILTAIENSSAADDADVVLLGYGVFVDAGVSGRLHHIKWGSTITRFTPAPVEQPIGEAPFRDSAALEAYLGDGDPNTPVDAGTFTQGTPGEIPVDTATRLGLQFFDVHAYSTPIAVGVFQADASGDVTVALTVETLAALPPGQHTLTLVPQTSSDRTLIAVTFTVVAAPTTTTGAALAETGLDATLPLVGGALLLAAGAVLVTRRRAGASA